MKINQLPTLVKVVANYHAFQRLLELKSNQQSNRLEQIEGGEINICSYFIWADTPEGHAVWENVQEGNYQPFYDFYHKHGLELFKPKPKQKVSVKLNNSYSAEYVEGENNIQVGCQSIPVSALKSLVEKIEKLSK